MSMVNQNRSMIFLFKVVVQNLLFIVSNEFAEIDWR